MRSTWQGGSTRAGTGRSISPWRRTASGSERRAPLRTQRTGLGHLLRWKSVPAIPEREEGGGSMSEERPQHTQEPAEGAEDAEEAPGVDRAGDDRGMQADDEQRSVEHPQEEPAEGAEEAEEAPGAE